MVNLFINEDDEITTYFTQGAELACMEDLIELQYHGLEGLEYQLQEGVFNFISKETLKVIAENEHMTDIQEYHDDWVRISTNKPLLYAEFMEDLHEHEEIESLQFNDLYLEAITKDELNSDIKYITNYFYKGNNKDNEVVKKTVMLH